MKEELLAANIRKQIAYLEGLLNQLEAESTKDKDITLQIRDVEAQLQELRNQL